MSALNSIGFGSFGRFMFGIGISITFPGPFPPPYEGLEGWLQEGLEGGLYEGCGWLQDGAGASYVGTEQLLDGGAPYPEFPPPVKVLFKGSVWLDMVIELRMQ